MTTFVANGYVAVSVVPRYTASSYVAHGYAASSYAAIGYYANGNAAKVDTGNGYTANGYAASGHAAKRSRLLPVTHPNCYVHRRRIFGVFFTQHTLGFISHRRTHGLAWVP